MPTVKLNPYTVLNLPRAATAAQVAARRRQLLRAYHPDANANADAAAQAENERLTKEVNRAADLLVDPGKRAALDLELRRAEERAAQPPPPSRPAEASSRPPSSDPASASREPPKTAEQAAWEEWVAQAQRVHPEGVSRSDEGVDLLRRKQRREDVSEQFADWRRRSAENERQMQAAGLGKPSRARLWIAQGAIWFVLFPILAMLHPVPWVWAVALAITLLGQAAIVDWWEWTPAADTLRLLRWAGRSLARLIWRALAALARLAVAELARLGPEGQQARPR